MKEKDPLILNSYSIDVECTQKQMAHIVASLRLIRIKHTVHEKKPKTEPKGRGLWPALHDDIEQEHKDGY